MAKSYELKTQKNDASVKDFLNFIVDEQKRKDCVEISKMMEKATKQNITLYIMERIGEHPLIEKLGKYKTSKDCLYIKKLADVDKVILQELINESAK